MTDSIMTKPRSIPGKTRDALIAALEDVGIAVDNAFIYLPHKRENGVFWIAVGTRDKDVIAIHGKSIAGNSVKNGMVITHQSGTLWTAVANSRKPRRGPKAVSYGNALTWDKEPMVDRLAKCVECILGHEMLLGATAEKLRRKMAEIKESQRND